jgi:hypothetical protein
VDVETEDAAVVPVGDVVERNENAVVEDGEDVVVVAVAAAVVGAVVAEAVVK